MWHSVPQPCERSACRLQMRGWQPAAMHTQHAVLRSRKPRQHDMHNSHCSLLQLDLKSKQQLSDVMHLQLI